MSFGLGSSSQLGIGIAISLNDKFSGQAAKINGQLQQLRANANSSLNSALRDYRNQAVGIAATAGAATMGMYNMAKAGAEYNHAINQMFIVGGKEIGKTRQQLDDYAQSMSKAFNRSPVEVAAAMFENVKQGVRGGLEEITKYQVATATATDEAIAGPNGVAANLLNIMNAFDLPQAKFKDVANAVTAVANATQANVYDLGEAMQYWAFTSKEFGLSMETTLSLFGKLAQVGIRGSSAGTGVNNMLTQMAKGLGPFQTPNQLAAWKMMGLDPKQIAAMVDSGNMQGVIQAVSQASKGMTATQKGSILPRAFNMRGTRAMMGLFDSEQGNKSIADIMSEAKAGIKGDLVMVQSKKMMDDLKGDFDFLANAFHRFRIAFAKAGEPALRAIMSIGIKVLDVASRLVDSNIGKIFVGLAAIVAPVVTVMFALRAAALTATLAMRSMSMTAGIGGFKSLLGAGLNFAGMGAFTGAGSQGVVGGAGVVKNAAGKWVTAPGNPMGLTNAAGKVMSGNRFISGATAASMGLRGGASTGLGLIGGLVGRIIPILGAIMMGVSVLEMFSSKDDAREEQKKTTADPLLAEYYKNMDEAYYGQAYGGTAGYMNGQKNLPTPFAKSGQFAQTIQVYMDGSQTMNQRIDTNLENNLDRNLLFNVQY